MSPVGQKRKSSVGLGMSAPGGRADENRAKADVGQQMPPVAAASAAPIPEGVTEATEPLARGPEEAAGPDRDAGASHTDAGEGFSQKFPIRRGWKHYTALGRATLLAGNHAQYLHVPEWVKKAQGFCGLPGG
jgi:hypothetical protein